MRRNKTLWQWLSAACLVGIATSAGAWEYQIVVEGAIIYQESEPPSNISYPPPGREADAMLAGTEPEARVISEQELRENLSRPHLVIIPDQTMEPRQAPR